MRLLITGSRDWTDYPGMVSAITGAVRQWAMEHDLPDNQPTSWVTLVHGGAAGADRMAAEIARHWGWTIEEHKADWRRYGRGAGPVRNRKMIALGADACLAFIRNHSRGATHCAVWAEEAGIPTVVYRDDHDHHDEYEFEEHFHD